MVNVEACSVVGWLELLDHVRGPYLLRGPGDSMSTSYSQPSISMHGCEYEDLILTA